MDLIPILSHLVRSGGSDIHLRVNARPVFRIRKSLSQPVEFPPVTSQDLEEVMEKIMDEKRKSLFMAKGEVDFTLSISGLGRFRVSFYLQRGTLSFAARSIPFAIRNFDDLNLPETLNKIADYPRGLILVTGPAGSGKSSTLAAIVNSINTYKDYHIVTIEDPIEYLHSDKKSIISQREIGLDTENYASALKSVVRQDPNVILIGEMRDLETIAAALTAAETGHLVLSTLHTINAIQTVTRIVDMFPPHQQNQIRLQLADTLRAVVTQRLLVTADGLGMVPATEILIVSPLVKKFVEDNNISEISMHMKQGAYYGMQTFNQSVTALLKKGLISQDTALAAAENPEEMMLEIRGISAER